MKILLSTPFDFTYPGGVNAHVYNLDRELQRMGHSTRILSPGAPDGTASDEGHVFRIGRAYPIPANGSLARVALSPFLGPYVREFLEREQFDVIHLHDGLTSTLHLTVLANSRTTNIATFHATNTSYLGYNLLFRLGRPVFAKFSQKIDYRIAVSPTARDFINYYFRAEYDLIPNGINFDCFSPHIEPYPETHSDRPTVLFVGRFDEPRKGFRYLLDAMTRVQESIPDARLLVVGPGDQPAVERHIARRRLRNVEFTGEVDTETLPALYACCDVFCAPSTGRESFGVVLLEAMAAGKPVVASGIDGYRSVIRDGREGILVEPRNPAQLSNAILSVLRDPSRAHRLGVAGRERARQFSWHRIAQRVVECYKRAHSPVDEPVPSLASSPSLISAHTDHRIGEMDAQRPGR